MRLRAGLYPVLRLIRRLRFALNRSSLRGYEQLYLAQQIVAADAQNLADKNIHHCEQEKFLADLSRERAISVIDFGGGGGRHGWHLTESGRANWTVVETEAMAAASNASLSEPGLSFFSKVDAAASYLGKVDVVHVSSALQYTPDPPLFLRELVNLESEWLIVEKTILTKKSEAVKFTQFSTLNENIPRSALPKIDPNPAVSYQLTAITQSEFFKIIQQAGFEVVERNNDPVQSHLPLGKGLMSIGLIARRKIS